jgi:hypothetical protein
VPMPIVVPIIIIDDRRRIGRCVWSINFIRRSTVISVIKQCSAYLYYNGRLRNQKKKQNLNPKVRTILMSAYKFEEEELYQSYMIEAVINSTIEKPVTMNRLYQIVRDELNAIK